MSYIDDGRALLKELEAVKKDRDEWKEECVDANKRFKDAEEKLRTAYPLSDTLQRWKQRAEQAEVKIKELTEQLNEKQAEIDRLMLEYCPDEMTEEQKDNWAKHQRPVSDDMQREIDSALMGSNAQAGPSLRSGPLA